MAGFRDQIESAKQMYDSGTRQQMAIQELIEHYINFITQSIRQRLLEVAQRITKTTSYEYRGVLCWERIPTLFFELNSYQMKKIFFNVDCQHLDITTTGKIFVRTLRDQLQVDEITLDGPFFSRLPGLRDGNGYYVVSPIIFNRPKNFIHHYNDISLPDPPDIFIIDEFSKLKASEMQDKLSLPVDYRFTANQCYHLAQDIRILENGREHILGSRSGNGEGLFMEIRYRL